MNYGYPSTHAISITDYIESIQVEHRLRNLRDLQRIRSVHTRQLPSRYLDSWYVKYTIASVFIDVRLLRLLNRIASHRRNHDELRLETASDVIEHMQKKYTNGAFDYLTPEYILEWYKRIGSRGRDHSQSSRYLSRLMCLVDEQIRAEISGPDSDKQFFVQMSMMGWQTLVIDSRIERLKLTGYEDSIEPDIAE